MAESHGSVRQEIQQFGCLQAACQITGRRRNLAGAIVQDVLTGRIPMNKTIISRRSVLKGTSAGLAATLFAPAIVRAAPSGTVYVESWGGTYAEAVKNYILEPFKEATGVDYKHGFFGNNSEQLAKLKTGKSRVDMTFISDSYILRGAKDNALVPITIDNVPELQAAVRELPEPGLRPGQGQHVLRQLFLRRPGDRLQRGVCHRGTGELGNPVGFQVPGPRRRLWQRHRAGLPGRPRHRPEHQQHHRSRDHREAADGS